MKPMKIYLAARYSRHPQMREIRDQLEGMGHRVTSRWIDQHGGKYPTSFTRQVMNETPWECAAVATDDHADLMHADTLIAFTETDPGGKGGRHVELGIALGAGHERIMIVGPREHVFHCHPRIWWFPDFDALARHWAPKPAERHDVHFPPAPPPAHDVLTRGGFHA